MYACNFAVMSKPFSSFDCLPFLYKNYRNAVARERHLKKTDKQTHIEYRDLSFT